MPESYQNHINGVWQDAAASRCFTTNSPVNRDEVIGEFAQSATEDAMLAIEAAEQAFSEWKKTPPTVRGKLLENMAQLTEKHSEDLASCIVREVGKTITEARGEVARTVMLFRYYGVETLHDIGEMIPTAAAGSMLFTYRQPVGPVSVISPWNFPVAIPVWKMAPALAYGCTVVLKPASISPLCAVKLVELFEKAGFPKGVVNLITGGGKAVGEELVKNPAVRAVTFTGSNGVGRKLAAWAAEANIKCQLEMGGKNAAIVLPDANMEQAVNLIVKGSMGFSGQKCTATSRAIVHEGIYDKFVSALRETIKTIKVGNPADDKTLFGPVASKDQFEGILEKIEAGKQEGAKLLEGGNAVKGGEYEKGYYIQPTLFGDVGEEMSLAREEVFGPVLSVFRAKDADEAVEMANRCRYGLSAGIFTSNLNAVLDYVQRIEAGIVKVNGETSGVEPQVAFGGMKESSSHSREMGRAAREFFTETKSVYVNPSL